MTPESGVPETTAPVTTVTLLGLTGPGSAAVDGRPSVPSRVMVRVVRVYQYAAAGRPSPCRHVPSCSTYAVEALEAHGALRGSWLALRRLGRCHPWGTSGYDPVPEPRRRRAADTQGSSQRSAIGGQEPMTDGTTAEEA